MSRYVSMKLPVHDLFMVVTSLSWMFYPHSCSGDDPEKYYISTCQGVQADAYHLIENYLMIPFTLKIRLQSRPGNIYNACQAFLSSITVILINLTGVIPPVSI